MALRDIKGHKQQVAILRQAVRRGRIPHAYMFTGIEGVGKYLVAQNLAKILNCQNPKDPNNELDSCDECVSCKKIVNKTHPDVHYVEPDGEYIKIEQLRDVLRSVAFKPYEGRWKIFIIDKAETFNPITANALLKTLEEPTQRTLFILLSARSNLILPTIMSRCQQVRFGTVPFDDLIELLKKNSGLGEEDMSFYARMSEGSIGRALSLSGGEIRSLEDKYLKDINMFLSRAEINDSNTMERFFDLCGNIAEERENIPLIIDILRSWYRDMAIWKTSADTDLIIHKAEAEKLKEESSKLKIKEIFRRLDLVDQLAVDIQHNANKQLAIENMMISTIS